MRTKVLVFCLLFFPLRGGAFCIRFTDTQNPRKPYKPEFASVEEKAKNLKIMLEWIRTAAPQFPHHFPHGCTHWYPANFFALPSEHMRLYAYTHSSGFAVWGPSCRCPHISAIVWGYFGRAHIPPSPTAASRPWPFPAPSSHSAALPYAITLPTHCLPLKRFPPPTS